MKILCVFGRHNYGDPQRGEGYEYTNFLPALRQLGHEIVHFESFSRAAHANFFELNRAFLEAVDRHEPDIVFCVLMQYELWLETLEIVRDTKRCVLINWSTDDSWKYRQFSRLIARTFDLYATTSIEAFERARGDGMDNVFLTQWAASSATLAQPLAAADCTYRVSFVGSAYGERPRLIEKLRALGIEVECFGHGWPRGAVAAAEIPGIIRASVISLNLGDSPLVVSGVVPQRSRQIKARIFEVPGAGGFLLTENAAHLDRYYATGDEIAVFDGLAEGAGRVRHYLAHPHERDRIAAAGHARTCAEHTYERRFESLLATAAARRRFKGQVKPALDVKRLSALERAHASNAALRLLRALIVLVTNAVWGRVRGPRAARRLVFELSWRLVGRKTYTASGWPGRMFYSES